MKKPEPGTLPETLKCEDCDHSEKVAYHCGVPMHIEDKKLACWMGQDCGVKELPKHHGNFMTLAFS